MHSALLPDVQIQNRLKQFRLSGMVSTLDLRLRQAQDDNLGYTEFLGLLLEDEANKRTDNKNRRQHRSARFPFEKGIEDFDFKFQPSINKQEILELATGKFIKSKSNILFIGQPGTGKTHLSVALGLKALGYGQTVLFTTAWDMITQLQQSRADFSYQKRVQTYMKPDLLILDELGYRSMAESTVEDFFEIISL